MRSSRLSLLLLLCLGATAAGAEDNEAVRVIRQLQGSHNSAEAKAAVQQLVAGGASNLIPTLRGFQDALSAASLETGKRIWQMRLRG